MKGHNLVEQYTQEVQDILRPDWQYIMIKYVFRSFNRYIIRLKQYARSYSVFGGGTSQLSQRTTHGFEIANILSSVETTLLRVFESNKRTSASENRKDIDDFNFFDFMSQMRGRMLKDPHFARMFFKDESPNQSADNNTSIAATPDEKRTLGSKTSTPIRRSTIKESTPESTMKSPRVSMDQRYQHLSNYLS